MAQFTEDEPLSYISEWMGSTATSRQPFLFAIARDAHTIFASWNIDWQSVFETAMPADRQIHLRVIGENGAVETTVAVEPIRAMHFLTTPGFHNSYRLEMGYFQPFDTWHSVAKSDAIEMPLRGSVGFADVDLVTIPFHLRFQQLSDWFEVANGTPVARAVSDFQKRVLGTRKPNETRRSTRQILRNLNLTVSEISAAERDFKRIDTKNFARRARATFGVAATSPVRGFETNAGS